MFPAFYSMLDAKGRRGFMKFNANGLLINIHLINLPLSLLDVYVHPRSLTPFDLWLAFAAAFLYVLFYLNVLDRRGLHIYIIMSPRTALFAVSVLLVTGIYLGAYRILGAFSLWCLAGAAL